ncbi:radical SAM protein, partial [Halopseudomonas pelagia]|uniref:radical SAM protein n=2 Tax=Halopseudomonas pelagia TaxID=553151 RepID=UPI0011799682
MAKIKRKAKPSSNSTRSSLRKPAISELAEVLQSLPASGQSGFEGLIAKLLTKLTSVPFLVRRAGSQQGRDADSSVSAAECIFIECKRYEESSSLDERALRTQIEISANAAPGLDMWVLATTRSVDASAVEWLAEKTREMGADFFVLSCGTLSEPADLDYLAAAFGDDVVSFCSGSEAIEATTREYLRRVREREGFNDALARIRKAFDSATVGLPSFRSRLNASLCSTLENEETSRLKLNAHLTSGEQTPVNVPRPVVKQQLDAFASPSRDSGAPRICVVQGDEGNGKSWAVATWVRALISKPSAPPVFWFKSSASKEGFYPVTADTFEKRHNVPKECSCPNA